jgi:hypothetical protein
MTGFAFGETWNQNKQDNSKCWRRTSANRSGVGWTDADWQPPMAVQQTGNRS